MSDDQLWDIEDISIPIIARYWNAKSVAICLDCSVSQVNDRYAPMPDFPKARRFPTVDNRKSHPKWKAIEIIEWADKWKEN